MSKLKLMFNNFLDTVMSNDLLDEYCSKAQLLGVDSLEACVDVNDKLQILGASKLEFKVLFGISNIKIQDITLVGSTKLLTYDLKNLYYETAVSAIKIASVDIKLGIQEFKNLFLRYVYLDTNLTNECMNDELVSNSLVLELDNYVESELSDFAVKLLSLLIYMQDIRVKEVIVDMHRLQLNASFGFIYLKIKELFNSDRYCYRATRESASSLLVTLRDICYGSLKEADIYNSDFELYVYDVISARGEVQRGGLCEVDKFFNLSIWPSYYIEVKKYHRWANKVLEF